MGFVVMIMFVLLLLAFISDVVIVKYTLHIAIYLVFYQTKISLRRRVEMEEKENEKLKKIFILFHLCCINNISIERRNNTRY